MKAKRKIYKIPLTFNKYALVDFKDYRLLSKFTWCYLKTGYAVRVSSRLNPPRKTLYMHREIMKPPDGMVVDHINHNKLDNRRRNLRVITQAENCQNYNNPNRGVHFNNSRNRFIAKLKLGRRSIHLGTFKSYEDAVECAREGRKKYFNYSSV